MGGQSSPTTPLFPGLLGPLEAAVGGLAGEGQTPDPDPGLPPHPLAAYLHELRVTASEQATSKLAQPES